MDRISKLPTEILHQILSLLSTKTATRTSVLSKPWLKACSTNPHLCFDESDFKRTNNGTFADSHGQFLMIVDNTLERYRRENLPISTFKLCITYSDQTDCECLVDKWLDIIAEKRVSQVSLLVNQGKYSLSADTIFAMESLQQLELNQCKILLKQKALPSEDRIKCSNLKNLTLYNVTVSESALNSLISSCSPHIMTISLHYCIVFNFTIRVSNMPNLLSLSILCNCGGEINVIDATNLLSFEDVNKHKSRLCQSSNGKIVHSLNIDPCQNLGTVKFLNTTIDDVVLFQLIQKLPLIKELSLHHCEYLKKIKISSSTLEVCSIVRGRSLVQATFDVPNLLSLEFSSPYKLLPLSFVSASSQCRISICYDYLWNVEDFMHLQRYLVELNELSVELTLCNGSFRNIISKCLRAASGIDHLPTPEVENLILSNVEYHSSELSYSAYFDAIFWACSPKSLTVQCGRRFKKFLRQQLLKKCNWRLTKCSWKEYLINAQIEYKKEIKDNWVTLDRNMLRVNPRIIEEIHTIRFKQTQSKEKNKESSISRFIPRWRAH